MDHDVLEQGPREPRRGKFALAAAVVVVALAVLAVLRFTGGDERGDRSPASAAPSGAAPSGTPWPTAANACGADVELPLVRSTPLRSPTGLEVLLGGPRLTRADVDTGRGSPLAGSFGRSGWVMELVRHDDDVYAAVAGCGAGDIHIVRERAGRVRTLDVPGVQELFGGPAGVWGLSRLQDDDGRLTLRGIAGPDLRLPPDMVPRGVAAGGIVAEGPDEGELVSGRAMYLLDPATGRKERKLGGGDIQAVGDDAVVWTGADCRFRPGEDSTPLPERTCSLHVRSLTGDRTRVRPLPENRVPAGPIVFSPDGRYLAFQLSRPRHELHFADRHPWTPAEIAVLDLETDQLSTVPDLTVPAKTVAGAAFSADGTWLVVTTNLGDHGELLVWRRGSDHLHGTEVRVQGPLAYTVPVLVTG